MKEMLKDINWTLVVSIIVLFVGDGGLIKLFSSWWKNIHNKDNNTIDSGKKTNHRAKKGLIVFAFVILLAINAGLLGFIIVKYIKPYFAPEANDLIYVLNDDDTITITGVNNKTKSDLVIPDKIDGRSVTHIADNAFSDSNAINISIPTSVETIEKNAFSNCKTVISITVNEPNSFYTSDHGILFNELKTELLYYPEGKKLGTVVKSGVCGNEQKWEFYDSGVLLISGTGKMFDYEDKNKQPWGEYRENIESIVFNGYITNIGNYAFQDCLGVKCIILPESISVIGEYGFENCRSIEEINIPNSCVVLKECCFCRCANIKQITIGRNVNDISSTAFYATKLLSHISVSSENDFYTSLDGALYDKSLTKLICYPRVGNAEGLKIPETVTTICHRACDRCDFTDLVIPSFVTTLEEGSFSWCREITSITIPVSIKNIPRYTFEGSEKLTDIYYEGTEENWKKIVIDKRGHETLFNATIHYQGEQQ